MKKIDFRVALPNLITILGLCLGLNSLKHAFEGDFEKALIFVVLASILDALDGRIARLIKGTSKFGAELDSLTDFVNFGVCPGIILYLWILNSFGFYGWLVSLIFVVSCCLRLARFNLDISEKIEKNNWKVNFFTGVPAPAAAGLALLPMIISFSNFKQTLQMEPIVILVIVILVSFLMISRIPTYAVKQIKISRSVFILIALCTVLFFGFLFKNTFETLTIVGFIYLFSIPVSLIHYLNLNKRYEK
jgi:CDP-diacylglycerol--serine O-phosphatidyltransferase